MYLYIHYFYISRLKNTSPRRHCTRNITNLIKEIEIEKDNYIKNGEIIEDKPNCFAIIERITDMKRNTIELREIS